ncbi:ComEA family DNA-binding protein [Flammeovirga agarivorans]|uniref:Helix-hairpin-helix domain-containing protein n=1 Tax=Flammeovirga agarivorans TaxID=2726742 RepID=A0A7X8SQP6_9BACT|nr:helix-hairpin-helix domain-containing protein [Flammeovirga agarivorans]NLR94539.1 helix-hairpin-helix domain-containing protein [Flammeovirga agarivorans]
MIQNIHLSSINKKEVKKIDPNFSTARDWNSIGIPYYLGNKIVRYRLKYGRFSNISDLEIIDGIDSAVLSRISEYLVIHPCKKDINERLLVKKKSIRPTSHVVIQKSKKVFTPFLFDPNDATEELLDSIGFTVRFTKNLLAYRSNGGNFRVKNDLLKLYGIDSLSFSKWKKFIDLPDSLTTEKEKKILFNLNLVSVDELRLINGVGKKTAERVVDFRRKLGGSFYHMNQLKEVFSLDSTRIEKLYEHTFITQESIIKININTCSFEQLATHPYLSYRQARWIVNYRKQHGNYSEFKDLLKIKPLKWDDLKKILPYLEIK